MVSIKFYKLFINYILNLVLCFDIIGNKIDKEDREIPSHVGQDFAQRHDMRYLETSAKQADNVEKLFVQIASELMEVKNILCVFLNVIKKGVR